jgi:hypothetical protein
MVGLLVLSCGDDGDTHPALRLERTRITMVVSERLTATEPVVIYNDGEGVLEITGITCTLPWITSDPIALTVQPHGEGVATLTADASSAGSGDYEGRLRIESNDPSAPALLVPLEVEVVEGRPASITVSPTLFNLALEPGDSTEVACTVVNAGSATGSITQVSEGCEWVSASPTSLDLPPGARGTITLSVRSAGLADDVHQCIVQIYTTDPYAPRYDVVVGLTIGAGGATRVVVAEEFTGTWCTYCPGAMMGLHALQQTVGRERLAMVAYHLSDGFSILAGQDRANLYGVIGIPHVWFDGTVDRIGGLPSTPIDYTSEYHQRASLPATMEITLSLPVYETATGSGQLRAVCRDLGGTGIDARLMVVMTGVDTLYSWQSFNHLYGTAIAFPSGSAGYPLVLAPGGIDTLDTPFSTPSGWWGRERELIAFAQNLLTKEILQGAVLALP